MAGNAPGFRNLEEIFNRLRGHARSLYSDEFLSGSRKPRGCPQVASGVFVGRDGTIIGPVSVTYRQLRQSDEHTEVHLLNHFQRYINNTNFHSGSTLYMYTENSPCVVGEGLQPMDCLSQLMRFASDNPGVQLIIGFQRYYHVTRGARGATEIRREDWLEILNACNPILGNMYFVHFYAVKAQLCNSEVLPVGGYQPPPPRY